MNIERLLEYRKDLGVQINGPSEFLNLGILTSDKVSLLTYCSDLSFLKVALSKDNVVAAFVKQGDAAAVEANVSFIFSDRPKVDFFLFHNHLIEHTDFYGADRPTCISPSANLPM